MNTVNNMMVQTGRRPERFTDAIAVVTGGRGAIGACIAEALRREGARVATLDRAPGADGTTHLDCDVTDADAVTAAVDRIRAGLGAPQLLVCAAGVVSETEIASLAPREWHRVVDASLTGSFLAMRALLPHMVSASRGAVVAISSGWATKGYARGSAYAAAKAGVEALVKSAALEVAAAGVRVNAVAPGPVLTPFLPVANEQFDDWRRERESAIPLGRLGEPYDVVGPALFLLSDESGYVTGQVLHVNGGLLMP